METKHNGMQDKGQETPEEVTLSITIEIKRIEEEHINGCLLRLNEEIRKIFPTEKVAVKVIFY